jgi:hypothetical protein
VSPADPAATVLLGLQRAAGNAAVGQLLARRWTGSRAVLPPAWRPRSLAVARQPAGAGGGTAPVAAPQPAAAPAAAPAKPSLDDEDIAWIPDAKKGSPLIGDQIDDWAGASKEAGAIAKAKAASDKDLGSLMATEKARIKKLPKAEQAAAEEALGVRVEEHKEGFADKQAEITEKYTTARIANRKRFMARMSCFLESKEKVKAHYSALTLADVPGTVWLAEPAARRLEMVRAELNGQGLEMPRSWVAQDLRSRHLHDKGLGMMAHPLGYSVDFLAEENPKIADERLVRLLGLEAGGREKTAMDLDAPAETGKTPSNPKGLTKDRARRLRYIAGMGDAAAAARAGTGTFDDAAYGPFLTKVEEQFKLVSAASEAFKASIPDSAKATLATVGAKFKKDLPALDAEIKTKQTALTAAQKAATAVLAGTGKKKIKPTPAMIAADPAVIAATEQVTAATARRTALVESMKQDLRTAFNPWIVKIAAKVKELNAIAPGGDLGRVPAVAELDAATAAVTGMQASLAKIQALSGKPGTEKQIETLRASVAAAHQKNLGLFLRVNDLAKTAPTAGAADPNAELLIRIKWLRDWRVKNAAAITTATAEIGEWGRLDRALTDFQFVFVGSRTVEDPAVAQLVSKGYFGGRGTATPGTAMTTAEANKAFKAEGKLKASARGDLDRARFNVMFFRAMVKYGFDPGVAWSPGSTDPMHFDFAAGLLAVKSGTECAGPGVNP